MTRCTPLVLLAVLLVSPAHAGGGPRSLRLVIDARPGATVSYSLPGTPVLRPAGRTLVLAVPAQCRGPFTFRATAPGHLPAFRHLNREALLRLPGGRIQLRPAVFAGAVADRLLAEGSPLASLLAAEEEQMAYGAQVVLAPDARGLLFSHVAEVNDPFRGTKQVETAVWWSPQSGKRRRIAYTSRAAERFESFLAEAGVASPDLAVSPDGEWLAYSFRRREDDGFLLHLHNLCTSERRSLPGIRRTSHEHPVWSPDGTCLAYLTRPLGTDGAQDAAPVTAHASPAPAGEPSPGAAGPAPASPFAIRILRWDGKGGKRIATGVCEGRPAFSPDGALLAYACPGALKVCDLRSGGHRVLARVTSHGDLAWSPDGRWLAFTDAGPHGVGFPSVAAFPGGAVRRLTRGGGSLAWLPDGRLVIGDVNRWSPDKGVVTCAVAVDPASGEVTHEFPPAAVRTAAASDPWRRPPAQSVSLPRLPLLLPTLPQAGAAANREGRIR